MSPAAPGLPGPPLQPPVGADGPRKHSPEPATRCHPSARRPAAQRPALSAVPGTAEATSLCPVVPLGGLWGLSPSRIRCTQGRSLGASAHVTRDSVPPQTQLTPHVPGARLSPPSPASPSHPVCPQPWGLQPLVPTVRWAWVAEDSVHTPHPGPGTRCCRKTLSERDRTPTRETSGMWAVDTGNPETPPGHAAPHEGPQSQTRWHVWPGPPQLLRQPSPSYWTSRRRLTAHGGWRAPAQDAAGPPC